MNQACRAKFPKWRIFIIEVDLDNKKNNMNTIESDLSEFELTLLLPGLVCIYQNGQGHLVDRAGPYVWTEADKILIFCSIS